VLLTAAVALNPIGIDFVRSAFFAGEQLARNIAQPIVLTAMAILALIGVLEWLVRTFMINRRVRGGTAS
jgi:flagellar biogenesis protein FliO